MPVPTRPKSPPGNPLSTPTPTAPHSTPVENQVLRIAAGASLLLVLGTGLHLSGKMGRDSRERMEQLAAHRVSAQDVRTDLATRAEDRANDPALFKANVESDAKEFGVEATMLELAEPQAYAAEIDKEPVVLSPGQSWSSSHVSATASVEKVRFQQHGAMVSARHSVLRLTNRSKTPVAYFAAIRSHDRGRCDVRGARMHNAMALRPDETAEIVVCAGGGKIRIDDLRVLEISELGYAYFSQVPPLAVGYDGVTATSHNPVMRVQTCRDFDTKGLAGRIQDGLTRWVDVADFYSRHNCHRFEIPTDYRHTGAKVERLPAVGK